MISGRVQWFGSGAIRLTGDEFRELRLALAVLMAQLSKVDTSKMGPSGRAKVKRHLETCNELHDAVLKARGKEVIVSVVTLPPNGPSGRGENRESLHRCDRVECEDAPWVARARCHGRRDTSGRARASR